MVQCRDPTPARVLGQARGLTAGRESRELHLHADSITRGEARDVLMPLGCLAANATVHLGCPNRA